ncbi:acyl-CoA carboxylase subunit epsilon [Georgenia sp. SYP-B2076]|uniref:acyl-CoA carboxylase subunit epsilon n=1 Tax=Georgenia sp. SYP-B2076 TaxID=2495881 RepID=UPI000F8F25A5|nr:acyl-CoA carboxylase subunit epsilon [Georgenia sp. SYP-B2076]
MSATTERPAKAPHVTPAARRAPGAALAGLLGGVPARSASSPEGWTTGGEDDAVAAALVRPGAGPDGGADAALATPPPPAVRVVRGRPDELELAALVAGIVAARTHVYELGGLPDESAEPVRGRWTDRARRLGMTPAPGAGAWRWSLHP